MRISTLRFALFFFINLLNASILISKLHAQGALQIGLQTTSQEKKGREMVTIGLSEKDRKTVADQLNKLLANEYVLYTKTLNYHWNVKGKNFGPLHALFQTQYEQLFTFVDAIAERSLALGFPADGSLETFSQKATLNETQEATLNEKEMIKNLLEGHKTLIFTTMVKC